MKCNIVLLLKWFILLFLLITLLIKFLELFIVIYKLKSIKFFVEKIIYC